MNGGAFPPSFADVSLKLYAITPIKATVRATSSAFSAIFVFTILTANARAAGPLATTKTLE
jgi:hypothetical protein